MSNNEKNENCLLEESSRIPFHSFFAHRFQHIRKNQKTLLFAMKSHSMIAKSEKKKKRRNQSR